MSHSGSFATTTSPENQYLYNGKEKQDELNLGWYDYGARMYDPTVGRWNGVDALAEHPNQIDKSTYAYAWNNPTNLTDPDGNCPECPRPSGSGTESEKSYTTYQASEPEDFSGQKAWYYHEGSDGHEAGWYSSSDYKNILTGTSWGNRPFFPLNVRALATDLIWGSDGSITEADLSTDELIALKGVVDRNLEAGISSIRYKDYGTTKGNNPLLDVQSNLGPNRGELSNSEIWDKGKNPYYVLKTTLGRANIETDDNGNVFVVDRYNFNDAAAQANLSISARFSAFIQGVRDAGGDPYRQARNIGRYYGSPNGEGPVVRIKIPQF